jgi:electron transfer flavoprotein alpha subunit
MVLIIAEHQNGKIKKTLLECVGVAQQLNTKLNGGIHAIALGSDIGSLASSVQGLPIAKLHLLDSPELAKSTTEQQAAALAPFVKGGGYKAVLAPASAWGKDLTARLAAKIPCGLATDIISLKWDGDTPIFHRPVYAGKAFADVAFKNGMIMATLRPNVFPPVELSGGTPEIGTISYDAATVASRLLDLVRKETGRVELTEADVIVSGGRGLKGPENWGVLEELADVLGAALGASRAAVDAGWIDHSQQVGQTGKTVSPKVYIACGISGAIQHLAGMSSSKVIVAINNNPEAPIFKAATFGIVGDMFKVVPILTQQLKVLLAH